MRALSVYEHDNPQKSDEVKNAQNTLGKALEYYFKKGYCSPDVPKQYRLLRGAEKERNKMFTKDFSKIEPEFKEKNIRFFEVLEEKKEVSILQNYGYTDWYSLLQVETAEEENAIPIPVFLNIIGCDVEKVEEDEYPNLLDRIFSSNGIKVKMIIDRFDEQDKYHLCNENYPDFVGGLITDKNMLLQLLRIDEHYMGYSSQELRDDPEVILEAVRRDCSKEHNFIYASPRLKKDKDFVLEACRLFEISIDHVDPVLLEDYKLVEALVKSDGDNFAKLPKKFREDKNLLLIALAHPMSQQYLHASAELKNDREVVLKAVNSDAQILERVPVEFKADAEVVMDACKMFSSSIKYASPDLQNDREFALKRAKINAIDSDAPTEKQWWDDEEIVLTIVKGWGHRLEYASERLKSNKKIAFEAVKQFRESYQYVGDNLKDDPDILKIHKYDLLIKEGVKLTKEYLDNLRSLSCSLGEWRYLFWEKNYFLERTDCSHPKNNNNFCQLWILPEKTFDKIFDDRKKMPLKLLGVSVLRQNFEKAKRALQLEEEATWEVKVDEIIEFHYTHSSSWGDYGEEVMFSIIPKK
ncbi:MAG: DUF4116 domain-containing protein [bacterium]